MKKTVKNILIIAIVIIIIGGCVGGYFIWRHNNRYIAKSEALDIALGDAGLSAADVIEKDVEFESNSSSAWYEVDFETHSSEYEYVIDAVSGQILNSYSQPEHAD